MGQVKHRIGTSDLAHDLLHQVALPERGAGGIVDMLGLDADQKTLAS